ncbi:hypothetical protein MD484_g8120, partial [Candolleomyces efflorescens]
MNFYLDHLLPLYRNRETDTPSPRDVGVDYVSSVAKYEAIVRIVNTVREVGLNDLVNALSRLITPLSDIYETAMTPFATHVIQDPDTMFCQVWMEAEELTATPIPGAKYAIAFTIGECDPFHALALAYLLLNFSEKHALRGKDNFQLVNLCYKLTPTGVYGALFYDANFAPVFRATRRVARATRGKKSPFLTKFREHGHKACIVEWGNGGYRYYGQELDLEEHVGQALIKIRALVNLMG